MSLDIEENHPEILVWLKCVEEAKKANQEVVKYFQDKLFKGSKKPKQFILNILNELKITGFLDIKFNLTDKGIEALGNGSVFLPQEGIYEISVINDPLIPQTIIDFAELKPNLHMEFSKKNENNSDIKKNIEIPKFITKCQHIGKINTISKNGYKSIIVSKISDKGNKKINSKETSLKLEIDEGLNLSLELLYRNNYHNFETTILDGNSIFEKLLSTYSPKADLNQYRIPISYSSVSERERNTFLKDIKIYDINISDIFHFDNAFIEQLPIFPQDQLSAIKWAEDLLVDSISSFVTTNELKSISEEICSNSAFIGYEIPEFRKENLLKNIVFGSKKYWFLTAPEDLQLERGLQK